MEDYNAYVTSINRIFDYLSKMKAGWSGLDNKNYIESIEEYKATIISKAEIFKTAPPKEEIESLEALGND